MGMQKASRFISKFLLTVPQNMQVDTSVLAFAFPTELDTFTQSNSFYNCGYAIMGIKQLFLESYVRDNDTQKANDFFGCASC